MTHQVQLSPTDLWEARVDALGLRVEDSPVWPFVQQMYGELAKAGVSFKPPCFVANEWGCPDGHPLIGVPFWLVDPRVYPFEEEHADDLEEGERIMMGLRHEAGHALNYAYRLYADPAWTALFGRFEQEYRDDYLPDPFARRCVRHLPGFYAQKHPDEDFAETVAVWLTPGLAWRDKYANNLVILAKLEYVDQAMARVGALPPVVDPAAFTHDPNELAFTVADYYRNRAAADAAPVDELGDSLDDDLRELFPAVGVGNDGGTLVWDRRRAIMRSVSAYSGARMFAVKSIIVYVAQRLRALGLRSAPGKDTDAIVGITALISSLTMKFLRSGRLAS